MAAAADPRPGPAPASQDGPHLALPSSGYQGSFLAALGEYHAEGRHRELDVFHLTDRVEFVRYVAALLEDAAHPGAPDRYVLGAFGVRVEPPLDGYVPQTVLWWVDGDEYLGRVNLRHDLNRSLLRRGGHIGYEIRPSVRRRGHATAMLAATLPLAAALGIAQAHIDCDVTNVASRRVIEKNGGVFEREERGSYYFLVPTA